MIAAESAPTPTRRWVRPVAGAGVLAVIVALAAQKLDASSLRAGLGLLAPWHVAAVLSISLVHIGTRAARYHALVRACGPRDYSWTDSARIFLLGLSAAAVTPARAGDLVKAKLVAPHGLGLSVGTGLVLVERIFDLVVVTVYALALSFVIPNQAIRASAAALLAVVVGIVALCSSPRLQAIVGGAVGGPGKRLFGRRYENIRDSVVGMFSTWTMIFRQAARVLPFLGASFGIWLVEFTKLWVLLRLVDRPVPLTLVISAYAASLIAGTVSALPFSEGVVGVTLVAVLTAAGGVDSSTASIAVVVDRAASTLPPILLWIVFAVRRARISDTSDNA